jgi:putative oxidoreductase
MDFGRTLLRTVVGALFVGHGTQKLFGWFGGHGPEGTAGFFESLGLRPGRRHAMLAGATEAGSGALLVLGLLTPVAASGVVGVMTTAIQRVHARNGVWSTNGGYEYNLVLAAAAVALAADGPGRPSLDAVLLPGFKGNGWALAALGAGVGGAMIATAERTADWRTPQPEDRLTVTAEPAPANGDREQAEAESRG